MDYLDIMLQHTRRKLAYLDADGHGLADATYGPGYDPGSYNALAVEGQDAPTTPAGPYCYCPTQYGKADRIGRWAWQ